MNAAVLHEALERDAGDLAADRIEAGEDDRFRRVVDDQVDARRQFERADVAAFASDDAALEVVARQRSEEHTSELQSHVNLVCRLLLEKKKAEINIVLRRLPNAVDYVNWIGQRHCRAL